MATQEHVSETLRRAVAGDRVGHAYLFCGPRGVGKTTLARVLAMALNCPDRTDEGEPCGVCDSCDRIWGGHTALDVVEIDAASNRGVDDARDLRERAMYAPSGENRYKIYIVDEAHMLTREAWNALLKILEEPPPRVIFIFATTEPQKIQQTAAPILSRCQRFDFRRIGISDIVARLESVLGGEDTNAPEDALRIIARKADGGMRDALSLLDQVLSLTGGDVDTDSVRRVLGLVEEEKYLELLDIIIAGRHAEVFTFVEELLDEGYDLVEFYHGLLDALRAVLRLRLDPTADLELRDDVRAAFVERAGGFEPTDLVRMLAAAAELENSGSLRRSANPRVLVEMLLLRLSYFDRTVDLEELIGALGGSPPPGGGAGRGPSGSRPAAKRMEAVPASPSATATTATPGAGEDPQAGPEGSESVIPDEEPAESSTSAEAAPPAATLEEAWARWLDSGKGVPRGLGAFLRASSVAEAEQGVIQVNVVPGPAEERIAQPGVLTQIAEALSTHLGRTVRLEVLVGSGGGTTGTPSADKRITTEEVKKDTLKALYREEPRLERAVQELDLELME